METALGDEGHLIPAPGCELRGFTPKWLRWLRNNQGPSKEAIGEGAMRGRQMAAVREGRDGAGGGRHAAAGTKKRA